MKKAILLCALSLAFGHMQAQITGIGDDFEDGILAQSWKSSSKFELFETKNRLQINIKDASTQDALVWQLGSIDISAQPTLTFKLKAGIPIQVFIEATDAQGKTAKSTSTIEDGGDLRTKDISVDFGKLSKQANLKKIISLLSDSNRLEPLQLEAPYILTMCN